MSLEDTMKAHMDAVRKVTGANDLLSLAASTDSLNSLQRIFIEMQGDSSDVNFNNINDLSFRYITTPGGVNNDSVPKKGAWWYLLTLNNNAHNAVQIAIPDNADNIYLRCKTASTWNAWIALGGGSTT